MAAPTNQNGPGFGKGYINPVSRIPPRNPGGTVVRIGLVLVILAAALAAASNPATACAPPCGPIPVLLEIELEQWKNLTFGDAQELILEGTVSFYVDVDRDGFYYDQDENPTLTFRVNREPPWMRTTIEPPQYEVPVNDAAYIQQDNGGADQLMYYWTAPVNITIERLGDPSPEDFAPEKRLVRHDGTVRVTVTAWSTSSLLSPDVFGPNVGLQEGYGVRDLRLVPEINGVPWIPNEDGVLVPADGVFPQGPEANAPGPAALGVLVGLAVALTWRRRLT